MALSDEERRTLEREHAAAVANGHLARARAIARRLDVDALPWPDPTEGDTTQ